MNSIFQQNIDIIKGFFKKPVVLCAAILSILSTAAGLCLTIFNAATGNSAVSFSSISNIFDTESFNGGIIDTSSNAALLIGVNTFIVGVSLLSAVSILMLYFSSKKAESDPTPAASLYKIISIIQLVVSCLVAALILLGALLMSLFIFSSVIELSIIIATPLLLLCAAYILLISISRFFFSCSIKKSLSSVYLCKGGALLFGIVNFISFVFEIFSLFATFTQFSVTSALSIISTLFAAAESLAVGLMAVMYYSYIKGINSSMLPPRVNTPPAEPQPYQGMVGVSVTVSEDFSPYEAQPAPQQFTPQQGAPQQVVPQQAPQEFIPQQFTPQQAPAQTGFEVQAVFCSHCGKQLNAEDYFCNHCGTPVKKDN